MLISSPPEALISVPHGSEMRPSNFDCHCQQSSGYSDPVAFGERSFYVDTGHKRSYAKNVSNITQSCVQ
jgi:hypothetical protein